MLLHSKWITYPTGDFKGPDDKYGNPSPYFRKTFICEKKVKTAKLYIAVLGVFKAYVNGREVSDEYLSPPWVDYTKKIPLMEYDITDKICDKNAVGIVLGDGWAVGHIGSTATFKRNSYNDTVQFSATVEIEYDDGHIEQIITDSSWLASAGAIRRSDIYMGEYIDAVKSLGKFSEYDYDDSRWECAEEDTYKFSRNIYIDKVDIPPIRVKNVFTPEIVSQNGNKTIYDVRQNIAGVVRMILNGERGAKVTIRHSEILNDGALYLENLRKAEATDVYVLSGDENEVFRPLFTYHGFRYFEIETDGLVEIADICAEVMYTDLDKSGEFYCSSDLVNKIYQNVLWSQRGNFYSVPTDCPQRDERLGWTGDAQVFCASAMYNMDCKKYYEKYLADIREAQLGNGAVPCVAPLPHIGFDSYTGYDASAGWSEAIIIIPYLHYRMYGDRRVIKDNIFAGKCLMRYYENDSRNFIRSGRDGRYGDWLNVDETTDLDVVATMYYAYAAKLMAELCAIINDEDEAHYAKLYDNIRNAFTEKFIMSDGKILSDTQSAYVMAYKFGLISAESAKINLERKLAQSNNHLTTGFLGIRFLLPALCDIGLCDNAYEILTQTSFPGWGYSIKNGATTIWEHWDSDSTERLTAMNSFNHYSLGSCVEWMYEYCLGICPDFEAGGFRKLTLRPYIDLSGKITSAKGCYNTPFGKISISWKRDDAGFIYKATIPKEIEVDSEFPRLKVIDTVYNDNEVTVTLG